MQTMTNPLDTVNAVLPPGPSLHPTLQLLNWIGRPTDWRDECANAYGTCFFLKLGQLLPAVFFSDPDAVQTIFKADPSTFVIGHNNSIIRPLVGDESVILLDGDRHQRQRQLLTPPFHGDRMRAYGELICDITRQVGNQWTSHQPFSVRPQMQDISLEVILNAVFGLNDMGSDKSLDPETLERIRTIKHLMQSLLEATGSPLSSTLL